MKTRANHGPPQAGTRKIAPAASTSRSAAMHTPSGAQSGSGSIGAGTKTSSKHAGDAGRDHGKPNFGAAARMS
jgi:hypothetical protein